MSIKNIVLIDRLTLLHYAITINDGQFSFEISTDAVSAEPILQDQLLSNTYWKCFIYDKQFAFESNSIVRNDSIVLYDTTLNCYYKLFISDAQFGYDLYSLSVLTRLKSVSEQTRLFTISDQLRLSTASEWIRLKESNKL